MVLSLQGRSHRFKSCSAHKGFEEIYPTEIQKTPQKPHYLSDFEKIKITNAKVGFSILSILFIVFIHNLSAMLSHFPIISFFN